MNSNLTTRTNHPLQIKLTITAMILALSLLFSSGFSLSTEPANQIALGMPALDAASKDSAVGGQSAPCVRADYCGNSV